MLNIDKLIDLSDDQLYKIWAKILQIMQKRHGQRQWPYELLSLKDGIDLRRRAYYGDIRANRTISNEVTLILCSGNCKKCDWSFKEVGKKRICLWEKIGATVKRKP